VHLTFERLAFNGPSFEITTKVITNFVF